MKLISAILALLLLAVPSHAKILVYKGTFKFITTAPPFATFPTVLNYYFIVDPDMGQSSSVAYYTKNGKHQQKSTPGTIYLTSAPGLAGTTKTAMTNGTATFTDATHFDASLFLLIGTNSTLQFTTMGATQTTPFPKTFTGPSIGANNSAGTGSFIQAQSVFSFQSKLTLAANDAGKTIADVTDQISMDLQTKGYMP